MDDPELEAIRNARMQQMQKQQDVRKLENNLENFSFLIIPA